MPNTLNAPPPATSGRPANPAATDRDAGGPRAFVPTTAPATNATSDLGATSVGAPSPTTMRTSDMNRPEKLAEKLDQKIDQTFDAQTRDKTAADASRLGDDAKRIKDDAAVVGEDLVALAREAFTALQRVADDIAAKASDRAGEAVDVAKVAGLATVDNVTAVAGDAKQRVESGVDSLSQSVARNPLTAVAIAAGIGMVFGLMNRSDNRR